MQCCACAPATSSPQPSPGGTPGTHPNGGSSSDINALPDASTAGRAVLRWAVDTQALLTSRELDLGSPCWDFLLGLLPPHEQQEVLRFMQHADKLRALMSRLMQRAAVSHVCGVPLGAVAIARTKGRKPFTTCAAPSWAPNFNFNVSHEGDFVVLAAEPVAVVGVDVAAPHQLRPRRPGDPLVQTLQTFKPQFDPQEWAVIMGAAAASGGGSGEAELSARFQRNWALKEAFIKARGDGLGFEPLSRARFQLLRRPPGTPPSSLSASSHQGDAQGPGQREGQAGSSSMGEGSSQPVDAQGMVLMQGGPACTAHGATPSPSSSPSQGPCESNAQLWVDGQPQPRWAFHLQELPRGHWVAVARGPPEAIVDAHGHFKATLRAPVLSDTQLQPHLQAPWPPLQLMQPDGLLALVAGGGAGLAERYRQARARAVA